MSATNTVATGIPKYEFIPQELKDLNQWVVWQYADREGKRTKPLYDVNTGKYASTNKPETWTTFTDAEFASAIHTEKYHGLGFVFRHTPEHPIIGIDFDNVLHDGNVDAYALAVLRALGNPYTEVSPSGNGLHAYVKCDVPPAVGRKYMDATREKFGIEVYSTGRYFTVTGNRWGTATEIATINADRFEFAEFLMSRFADEKFKSLWTGTYSHDDSAMDLALCNYLARNFSSDPAKIDASFRLSYLIRPKWNEKRGTTTYGDMTIAKALASLQVADTDTTATDDDEEAVIVEEPLPEFPPIPGLLTEMSDALCPDLPREFKIMAAVTRIGLILSGKTTLKNEEHLQPRFYTCLLANPGYGKTASMNETERQFINAKYLNTTSVDSGPALIDTFEEASKLGRGGKVMLAPDELSDLFEKSKSSKDGKNSLFGEFLKLFEGNMTGNRTRSHGAHDLTDAHLSIIGGVPPDKYADMWTATRGGASGLQSRFTLVTTTAGPLPVRVTPTDTAKLTWTMDAIRKRIAKAPAVLSWDADAIAALESWWKSKPRHNVSEARIDSLVKRFLIVLAVLAGTATVTLELVQVGIAFGDYQSAVRERFNVADAASYVQTFENRILAAYKRYGAMTDNTLRQHVTPEKLKGGVGPYLTALKNLRAAGFIISCGKTQRAEKWGLPHQQVR